MSANAFWPQLPKFPWHVGPVGIKEKGVTLRQQEPARTSLGDQKGTMGVGVGDRETE